MTQTSQAKKITYFAVFTALTVVLQFVGGYMRIGPVNLNFTLIPLVLCGMLLGIVYATALGFIIGAVFLIQGITGLEPFTGYLFSESPVLLTLTCVLKTTVAGAVGAFVYKALQNGNKYLATFASAAVVPVVNTAIFVFGMVLIKESLVSYLTSAGLDVSGYGILYIILVIVVTWNFFIEFGLNLLLAPAVYRVIKVADKGIG